MPDTIHFCSIAYSASPLTGGSAFTEILTGEGSFVNVSRLLQLAAHTTWVYMDLMVDGAPLPHQPDTIIRWLIDRLVVEFLCEVRQSVTDGFLVERRDLRSRCLLLVLRGVEHSCPHLEGVTAPFTVLVLGQSVDGLRVSVGDGMSVSK